MLWPSGWLSSIVIAAVVSGSIAIPRSPDTTLEQERRAKFVHGPRDSQPTPMPGEELAAVVALVRTGPGVRMLEPSRRRATLDQIDKTFVPSVLPIVVGTTVDFPNHDEIYHNVFSYSKAKRFDLGRYASEETRSVRFDKPGVVRVFCEIHSFMRAAIIVLPTTHYTIVDESGTFELRDVPAGQYEVLVWHDGLSELESVRTLSVAATDSIRIRLEP
jgi:plastocyanin